MTRRIRYQGAIIQDDQILLIKHCLHETGECYWVIPGGGREDGESEEECVRREMREETNLSVKVVRLLLDDPDPPGEGYQLYRTYLCHILDGQASPGYEPEADAAEKYAISEVGWFDLRDAHTWEALLVNDPFTYPLMLHIQAALGYTRMG